MPNTARGEVRGQVEALLTSELTWRSAATKGWKLLVEFFLDTFAPEVFRTPFLNEASLGVVGLF